MHLNSRLDVYSEFIRGRYEHITASKNMKQNYLNAVFKPRSSALKHRQRAANKQKLTSFLFGSNI